MPLFTFRAKQRGGLDFDVTASTQDGAIDAVTQYCAARPMARFYLDACGEFWPGAYDIHRYNSPPELEETEATLHVSAGFHGPGIFTALWF